MIILNISVKTVKEIKAKINDIIKAYIDKDLEKTLSLFARQKNTLLVGSAQNEIKIGIKNISNAFIKTFKNLSSIKMKLTGLKISGSDTLAWVYSNCEISAICNGKKINNPNFRWTIIFKKIEEEWFIIHSHFSLPAKI